MNKLFANILDHLFPMGGGVTGSLVILQPHNTIDIIITAAIGAVIAYFIKLGLDRIFKYKK